jgi:hypothetical protein
MSHRRATPSVPRREPHQGYSGDDVSLTDVATEMGIFCHSGPACGGRANAQDASKVTHRVPPRWPRRDSGAFCDTPIRNLICGRRICHQRAGIGALCVGANAASTEVGGDFVPDEVQGSFEEEIRHYVPAHRYAEGGLQTRHGSLARRVGDGSATTALSLARTWASARRSASLRAGFRTIALGAHPAGIST